MGVWSGFGRPRAGSSAGRTGRGAGRPGDADRRRPDRTTAVLGGRGLRLAAAAGPSAGRTGREVGSWVMLAVGDQAGARPRGWGGGGPPSLAGGCRERPTPAGRRPGVGRQRATEAAAPRIYQPHCRHRGRHLLHGCWDAQGLRGLATSIVV